MTRVLIIGEAPGARSGGRTRDRISQLAGRPWEEWADWRNLLDDWPGASGRKGSSWDVRAAREGAKRLRLDLARSDREYDVVVLLGRRVAGAMIPAGAGYPFFRWIERGGDVRMVVIPHTSGIVRWWNDPANVERAATFLTDLANPRQEEERMSTEKKKKLTVREVAVAALRAAGRPLTPNEVAECAIGSGVSREIDAAGSTPMDYRIAAPIYREAKKGRFYKLASTGPSKFALRGDAPESDPKLVERLRKHLAGEAGGGLDVDLAAVASKTTRRQAKPDPKKRKPKAAAKS